MISPSYCPIGLENHWKQSLNIIKSLLELSFEFWIVGTNREEKVQRTVMEILTHNEK